VHEIPTRHGLLPFLKERDQTDKSATSLILRNEID
jgi:hypothetical protein